MWSRDRDTAALERCGICALIARAGGVGLAYVYAICVRRFFVPRLEADFTFWKSALTEAWPMAAAAVSVIIFFRIDVVMISVIQGTTAVGFYSVAYTLSEASLVIPGVFISSLFPVLSKLHRDSKQFVSRHVRANDKIPILPCSANGVFRHAMGKADRLSPLWSEVRPICRGSANTDLVRSDYVRVFGLGDRICRC